MAKKRKITDVFFETSPTPRLKVGVRGRIGPHVFHFYQTKYTRLESSNNFGSTLFIVHYVSVCHGRGTGEASGWNDVRGRGCGDNIYTQNSRLSPRHNNTVYSVALPPAPGPDTSASNVVQNQRPTSGPHSANFRSSAGSLGRRTPAARVVDRASWYSRSDVTSSSGELLSQ